MNMPTATAIGNWPATPQPFTPPPPPLVPARKPVGLVVSVWLGVGVAVLSIAGALVMIFNGKDAIRAYIEKSVSDTLGAGIDPALIDATVGDELDTAYHKVVVKAVVAIVVAVLILAFVLVARNGSTGGRVGLTIALVGGMFAGSGWQLADMDVLPSLSVAVASLTPLLSLIAIVGAFLPATIAYAEARTAAR